MEEEEPGEPELVDQLQLLFEPRAGFAAELVPLGIAILESTVADLCELDDRGLWTVREVRVAITELFRHVELQPLGELDGARNRSSVLRKPLRHLGRGEQHTFVVAAAFGLAAVERAAVTDRDEDVLQPCAPWLVRVNVAGDDRGDAERIGEVT